MPSAAILGRNLPPPQSPFVDKATGNLSSDGYQFLLKLLNTSLLAQASVGLNLAANGASQATALQLASQWNVISVAAPLKNGVLLSALLQGQEQAVFNQTGIAINIYPAPGSQIDALGVNVPYNLASGKMQIFSFVSTTQIQSTRLG